MSRYRSNQVIVTGTMESAFKAREQLLVSMQVAMAMPWSCDMFPWLQGCLPVVLMFDVHESDSNTLSSCESLGSAHYQAFSTIATAGQGPHVSFCY